MKNKQCLGMADVSSKALTARRAMAEAKIVFTPKAYKTLMKQGSPKGDVFETAKIAAVLAAKATPSIVPLCHPLPLDKVKVEFEKLPSQNAVKVRVEVLCTAKTGVEMEALTAVCAACLTIYDMSKWMGQDMVINSIMLVHKSGGQSGEYQR